MLLKPLTYICYHGMGYFQRQTTLINHLLLNLQLALIQYKVLLVIMSESWRASWHPALHYCQPRKKLLSSNRFLYQSFHKVVSKCFHWSKKKKKKVRKGLVLLKSVMSLDKWWSPINYKGCSRHSWYTFSDKYYTHIELKRTK